MPRRTTSGFCLQTDDPNHRRTRVRRSIPRHRHSPFSAVIIPVGENRVSGNSRRFLSRSPRQEQLQQWTPELRLELRGSKGERHGYPGQQGGDHHRRIVGHRAGGGSIVFTSSFVGTSVGLPGMGAYAAAKAGLMGLVKGIAADYGARGIRANALLPGGTDTGMAGDQAQKDWAAGLHAMKRIAAPEEIANAALFLAGPHASFVTGSALYADGGNAAVK